MSWKSTYTTNPDGTIAFNPSWAKNIFGNSLDEQQYVTEYNEALRQYNQQYGLQREAFELNKQNLAFNQDLATRQQELSEESYYNGVKNQARQMAELGINPASAGGSISGMSMSGGSNVGGVSSGSVSGRNPNKLSNIEKRQLQLAMLGHMLNLAKVKSDIEVNEYNAETSRIEAETGAFDSITRRGQAGSQYALNQAQIEQIDRSLEFLAEHGYYAGSGASTTQENVSKDRLSRILTLFVGALVGSGFNNRGPKNSNRNKPSNSKPSKGSSAPAEGLAPKGSAVTPRGVITPDDAKPFMSEVDSRDFVKALTSDVPREQWNKLTYGLSQLQLKDILKMALPIALAVVTGGLVTI